MNMQRDDKIDLGRCEAESERVQKISRRGQALLAAAGVAHYLRGWVILRVASRRDNDVENLLSRAMIEHWLPLRKKVQNLGGKRRGGVGQPVWELAWEGYVFAKVADTPDAWHGLMSVKHVKSVLGVSERPFFIDDAKMMKLRAELASLKPVCGPEIMLIEGQKVKVIDGPFAGNHATVTQTGGDRLDGRARVEVMIFGRGVPVEFNLAQLAKGE